MVLRNALYIVFLPVMLAVGACDDSAPPELAEQAVPALPAEDADEAHLHPAEGPYGGALIELGAGDYHAELVYSELEDTVRVYILGSDAASPTPIAADELTINVTHDGAGEQFQLIAAPDEDEPLGTSSRFAASDPELVDALRAEGVEAYLVVSIEGQQFRGEIDPQALALP